jgi:hypothetical protein
MAFGMFTGTCAYCLMVLCTVTAARSPRQSLRSQFQHLGSWPGTADKLRPGRPQRFGRNNLRSNCIEHGAMIDRRAAADAGPRVPPTGSQRDPSIAAHQRPPLITT